MDFIETNISKSSINILMVSLLLLLSFSVLVYTIKNSHSIVGIIVFVFLLVGGLFLTYKIELLVERIHIIEYAFLAWFVIKDASKGSRGRERILSVVFVCVFTFSVGVLDELFQAILPYRYYDFRDIVFNCLGGVWGVGLYLLGGRD